MAVELNRPIRIRIDEELDSMISAIAVRRGETKAEVIRRLLRKGVEEENAKDSIDPVAIAVRKAMADVLRPVEERLAKINAKSAIAAATVQYMTMQLYHDMGKDAMALYEEARKRAVAFVKLPHDELVGVKDE
jgi:negative regulator of replication initiation